MNPCWSKSLGRLHERQQPQPQGVSNRYLNKYQFFIHFEYAISNKSVLKRYQFGQSLPGHPHEPRQP